MIYTHMYPVTEFVRVTVRDIAMIYTHMYPVTEFVLLNEDFVD